LHDPQGLLRTRPDRLALSNGTRPVSSSALSGYLDTAFVPHGAWRNPSSQERRLLLAAEPPVSIGWHITLVRVTDELMAHFAAMRERIHGCSSFAELVAWLDEHPCMTGCDAMLEFARRYLKSEDPLMERARINCWAGGLPTATTDTKGTHVGLHVDNSYNAELGKRASAPNRLSVNLGVEARSLLYVNLPLATIGALTGMQDPLDSRVGDYKQGLRHKFMSRFASYPVVRVRLDPGEGYIAPTENLIHDAITSSKQTPDVQFMVQGRFWPSVSGKPPLL
jgi:hypothetical protein